MRKMEGSTGDGVTSIAKESARSVSFQFNPERYRAELDNFDMTEAQKQEMLATLWSIMCSFVELGFSVDVCSALLSDDTRAIPDSDQLR